MRSIKKRLISALLVILATGDAWLAQGQRTTSAAGSGPQTTVALSDVKQPVLEEIKTVEAKLVKASQDFPENRFNTYRPDGNKDLATVAELLLEVADFNATSAYQMSTKEQQRALKKPDDKDYDFQSKADTVMKVKQSFVAVRKAIQDNPDPDNLQDWLFVISFSNVIYGRVQTYFRLNGLAGP